MVTQELLDFIKKQAEQGINRETIYKELLDNGWVLEDIEEAFASLVVTSREETPQENNSESFIKTGDNSNKNILMIALAVFLLLVGLLGYFFRDNLTQLPVVKYFFNGIPVAVEENPAIENKIQEQDSQPEIIKEDLKNDITTTKQEEASFQVDSNGLKAKIDIKADITKTVDCGTENCFQQKFSACQPATLKADAGFASVEYKIIEPADNGCRMNFKYLTNPNPDWVNKDMTCVFDNKIGFQKSIENTFNGVVGGSVVCTGPLYNILKAI